MSGTIKIERASRLLRIVFPLSLSRRDACSTLAILLLAFAGFCAEPPSVQPLSLTEAQRTAFERNWDLLAAKSDVDMAAAQRIVAREFPNPVANLSVAKISVDQKYPNQGGAAWNRDYDSIVAITQLIEIGGKRTSRQESAKAGLESARARFADARRTLELGVAQSYADTLQAQANAQVLRESAASLRKESGIAADRLNAGDISASGTRAASRSTPASLNWTPSRRKPPPKPR